ncbi:Bug family tripartite tricarboxylate transporter substrate binding protein [Nocardiopsis alba]|uniref:Bug family tripartite tricarboxylate transporter substrate binding protein n=1 Tax=Nocardiopsis alba TaxID=53437 RepID=UPI00364A31AD
MYSPTSRPADSRTGKRNRRALMASMAVAPLILAGCGANDGEYPSDSIEYIVPYNPGGGADPVGRQFVQMLETELDANGNVINVPGGDEAVGITQLANADADGYTLGLGTSGGFVAQPLVTGEAQYETPTDFTPLAKMSGTPYGLFVSPDSEYETLDDLIEAAKQNPGDIQISTPARMGNPAFVIYFLEEQADIEVSLVTTAGGTGEAALEVMSGRLDAVVGNASGQLGLVESGDLRALAYSGPEDYSDFLPDAVRFDEAGYEIPFTSDYMTMAPAGLDEDVASALREASDAIVTSEEWEEWARGQGTLPHVATGEELDTYLEDIQAGIEHGIELGNDREN